MSAIPAIAATINIPGVGNFDVPVPQEYEAPVQQLEQLIQQAVSANARPRASSSLIRISGPEASAYGCGLCQTKE
ncbi:hypothetical protein [Nocardia brasiliensis]|uniref:hypothetical protein n=1 Tax=Nocardia brasiliensis TaxID=37326 RepID=UPI0024542FB7|nr:hypothetical protein [Nocardia brasiliensis]